MKQFTINECLTILNLKKYESKKQVKTQYKKLINKYHPDKDGGDEEIFKTITEAYNTLISLEPTPIVGATNFNLDISFVESLTGIKINTHIGVIDIPAGIKNKTKIKYGNYVIEINVLSDANYTREKDDIFTSMYVSTLLAITGGDIEFLGPYNTLIRANIPQLTDYGTILRLVGEGAINTKDGIKGDLYIKLLLKTPCLTPDEINAIVESSTNFRSKI